MAVRDFCRTFAPMKQILQIGGRECLLYKKGEDPRVLLIQMLGAQERGSIDSEVAMISEASGTSFVMAAFAIGDWEVELTPWANMLERRSVMSQTR